PRLRPVLALMALVPFVVPPIVLVVGLLNLYKGAPSWFYDKPYGFLAAAYVILAFPYMYFALDAGFRSIDLHTLTEASQSLGANSFSSVAAGHGPLRWPRPADGVPRAPGAAAGVRPGRRAGRDPGRARDGRVPVPARALRVREDDGAPPRRRLRPSRFGLDRRRREGPHTRLAQPSRHGDGLPGVQPLPEHDCRAERRVRPAYPEEQAGRPAEARERAARARRPRARRQALSAPALRRHAAARRARARVGDRAARPLAGRAAVGARRKGPRAAARG